MSIIKSLANLLVQHATLLCSWAAQDRIYVVVTGKVKYVLIMTMHTNHTNDRGKI